jgi:hypothetical protein
VAEPDGEPAVEGDAGEAACAAFLVPPGRVRVTVVRAGVVIHREDVGVGSEGRDLRIAVPQLVRFRGALIDGSGLPVAGAAVTVSSGAGHARLLTARDGTVHAPPLPGGVFRIAAIRPGAGRLDASVAFPGDRGLASLTLRRGRRVRLVVDAAPGETPPPACAAWIDPVTAARTDAGAFSGGVLAVEDAATGDHLRIEAPGHVPCDVQLGEEDVRAGELRVRFVRARRIEGRVLGPDGRPVVGAEVGVAAPDGGLPADSGICGPSGFRLCGVPEGSVVLAVRSRGVVHRFRVRVSGDGDVGELRWP